jgi:hypothetical protein
MGFGERPVETCGHGFVVVYNACAMVTWLAEAKLLIDSKKAGDVVDVVELGQEDTSCDIRCVDPERHRLAGKQWAMGL